MEVSLIFRHFHPIVAGAAERFRRYSQPLSRHGVRFQVFTLKEGMELPAEEQMHAALHVRRIEASGEPWERDGKLFEAACLQMEKGPVRGRVLQTSLAHPLARPWLQRLRRRGHGCLYVGTMVGGDDEVKAPLLRRLVRHWRARLDFAPFQTVVASTTVMADWFASRGVSLGKIEVIPNGVDIERFRPVGSNAERQQIRGQLGLPMDKRVVIFAGSIVPRKGVDLLLKAWRHVISSHPDTTLVLVGGFARPTFMTEQRMKDLMQFQQGVRDLAESAEMKGSVLFPGETDKVEEWLRAADAFVFPTEQEGMGNVVLEAMACALPSVITQFRGMPKEEFGSPGREFHLVDRTEAALGEGLKKVLGDPAYAASMSLAAREWARNCLDVKLTINRYADLYRRLAGVADGS